MFHNIKQNVDAQVNLNFVSSHVSLELCHLQSCRFSALYLDT